jgi:hypothetical protein
VRNIVNAPQLTHTRVRAPIPVSKRRPKKGETTEGGFVRDMKKIRYTRGDIINVDAFDVSAAREGE